MKKNNASLMQLLKSSISSERGDIGESFMIIIAIGVSVILMFIFPLMTVSDRVDDMSQAMANTTVTEFVDDVRQTGMLTLEKYEKFYEDLTSDGNAYDVEMTIGVLDENGKKKVLQTESTKIGENASYSEYTSQILDELQTNKVKKLKEGDFIYVSVKNANPTLSQQLKNFFYLVVGDDTYMIVAQDGGLVTVDGK